MKKILILLFSLCASQAYADSFDAIVNQADSKPPKGNITLTGIDLFKGYEVEDLSYTKDLSSSQCLNFSLSPKDKTKNAFSSDNLRNLLKQEVEIHFSKTDEAPLTYSGLINKISYQTDGGRYTVSACGKISLMNLRVQSKLFVNASRIEAIQDTLNEHGLTSIFDLRETYPKTEFLTRLDETDFNFVKRLIEEMGLFYTIKNIEGKETYVFVDNLATLAKYGKKLDYKTLNQSGEEARFKSAPSLSIENSIQSDNYRLIDYDLLNDKGIDVSANDNKIDNVLEEYQISDYPPAIIKKVAEVKLAAMNSETNTLRLETDNPDIDVGDQIKIGNKDYHVISAGVYFDCSVRDSECRARNNLALFPTNMRYASKLNTAFPSAPSSMIAFVSDPIKDSYGRLGFRFPWMSFQNEDIMYRGLLSENAKQFEYKKGDKLLINFVSGFPDRPIIVDKM